MRIISGAIRNPVAIGVTVLLISLFGLLALKELPLQLFPDIERPTISIFTNWRGVLAACVAGAVLAAVAWAASPFLRARVMASICPVV